MVEQYQTEWVKGEAVSEGVRRCDDRYEIVKSIAERYDRPFSVLDIGANLGYFGFRLMEDFDCQVTFIEGHPTYADALEEQCKQNQAGILLTRHFNQEDLRLLGEVEHFDIVLALSVVHHIQGDVNKTCRLIEKLGDHVIFEMPNEKNACGQRQVHAWYAGDNWEHIGSGESHLLDGKKRPIYLSQQSRETMGARYIGVPAGHPTTVRIESDYERKRISWRNFKEEPRNWLHGINLATFRHFMGRYPSQQTIMENIETIVRARDTEHGDVRPHNFIIGNYLYLIDENDPQHNPSAFKSDLECLDEIKRWFAGEAPHYER